MRSTAVPLAFALLLVLLLLWACGHSDPFGPDLSRESVIASPECTTCDQEPVEVSLVNPTSESLYYLLECPFRLERLAPSGSWEPASGSTDCDCDCPSWRPLPSGSNVPFVTYTAGAGTYRSLFSVGWNCATSPDEIASLTDCDRTELVVSTVFEVLP